MKQLLETDGRVCHRFAAVALRVKAGQRLAFDHITTTGNQLRENVQLLIQQNFKDIGAEMTIKNQPTDQLFGSYAAERER